MLSAVFTFGLLFLQAAVARATVPYLIDLLDTAPRLAILGFFGLFTLPATATMIAHRFGSRFLDRYAQVAGTGRIVESVWAGTLVWLVIYGATMLTRFIYLLINPPQPDPDAFTLGGQVMDVLAQMSPAHAVSVFAGIWLFVAAVLFEIEQRARKAR